MDVDYECILYRQQNRQSGRITKVMKKNCPQSGRITKNGENTSPQGGRITKVMKKLSTKWTDHRKW